MKKFLSGILRALCVMSVCVLAGCSYAGDGGSTPSGNGNQNPPSIDYGNTSDSQGTKVIAGWMDTDGNIKIGGTAIAKTSEVVAVPTGTVAEITMAEGDNSSWSTYCSGTSSRYKGVFLSGRKVKLDPFVMSQYQVTQKLYMQVMGLTDAQNPSHFKDSPATEETQENRPVEQITWYQACAFCNELTKKTFGNTDQCVYYSDADCQTPYTTEKANSYATVYPAYNTTTHKWTKTGYRLPTEAEWEFCARGGDPNAKDNNQNLIWNFAYAGVQTEKEPSKFTSSPYSDAKLDDYGWNSNNSSSKTHEVGKKAPNTLFLYDMSGNVWEWCYDAYDDRTHSPISNDTAYTTGGYVINPLGESASFPEKYCLRGGSWISNAYYCSVSYRDYFSVYGSSGPGNCHGFRVCRSSN